MCRGVVWLRFSHRLAFRPISSFKFFKLRSFKRPRRFVMSENSSRRIRFRFLDSSKFEWQLTEGQMIDYWSTVMYSQFMLPPSKIRGDCNLNSWGCAQQVRNTIRKKRRQKLPPRNFACGGKKQTGAVSVSASHQDLSRTHNTDTIISFTLV